jgi:hypothetical protein
VRAFLLYIDDWLSSKHIATMDAAEERGYLRLLLHAATEEDCGLPNDDAVLAIYSKLGPQWFQPTVDEQKRLGLMTSGEKLRKCFEEISGRLYNTRLLKEFVHQKEVQAKRAESGRLGGKAKASAKQLLSKCQAIAKQTPSNGVANGVANGWQKTTNDVCVSVSSENTDLHTTTDKTDTEQKPPVSDVTVFDLEPWAERLYEKHIKRRDRALVNAACLNVLRRCQEQGTDPAAKFRQIENSLVAWNETPQWQEKDGHYAPSLAKWMEDRGYERMPKRSGPPPTPRYVPLPIPEDCDV